MSDYASRRPVWRAFLIIGSTASIASIPFAVSAPPGRRATLKSHRGAKAGEKTVRTTEADTAPQREDALNLWPEKPVMWRDGSLLYVSVPFTWNLPELRAFLSQRSAAWTQAFVGGPAVDLMPDFLADLTNVKPMPGEKMPNVLQRVNPMATRTTEGCIRSCQSAV